MALLPGEIIIDDSNYLSQIGDGQQVFAGGEMRLLSHTRRPANMPKGSYGAKPFGVDFKVIPRNEWDARIEELERTESAVSHHLRWESLDQDGIPYCWIFGCVGALMAARSIQNLPDVYLRPESAGAMITGGVARGGYGAEGLKYLSESGVCNYELWPDGSIRTSNENEQTKADRANHRILEWYEGDDNNFDQLMTLLFHRIPCPLGLDWWSHLIFACDPVKLGADAYGVRFRNSWGKTYGGKNKHGVGGFNTLSESKSRGDFFGIRQVTASWK